jgi:hypothetical protein
MGVAFRDVTQTRLTDNSYFVNTSLAGWSSGGFFFIQEVFNPFDIIASGTITSLQLVPEPSIALLFGLGLAGLGCRGRVQHSSR